MLVLGTYLTNSRVIGIMQASSIIATIQPRKGQILQAIPSWLLEGLLLVVLLLGWGIGMLGIQRQPQHHPLDLNDPALISEAQFAGLYGLEQNEAFSYRWTSSYFFVQLPWAYQLNPNYIALVRLQAGPVAPRPLTFLGNERPIATTLPTQEFRIYRFLLPPMPTDDPNLRLALATEPALEASDIRPLGVIVTDLELLGLARSDLGPLLLVSLGVTLLWGLVRWRGAYLVEALLLCASLAATLLIFYAWMGLGPLPYMTMAACSIAGTIGGVLLARDALVRLGLALLSGIVSFSSMLWASWLSDDAFISFHYAQNLILGHGLVYNPGERVEGYTNFLYTMLAALLLWLGVDVVVWSYLSGVGFALGLVLLTYALGSRLIAPRWGLVAALLLATSQSVLLHSARGGGLETALYALLVLSGVGLYLWSLEAEANTPQQTRALVATGFVLALTTLTRPEGVLLLALTVFHAVVHDIRWIDLQQPTDWLRRKLGLIALVTPYLAIIVPFFLWRFSYYGELLPNTFYAKTGGGLRAVPRGLAYSLGFAQTMGGPLLLLGLVGLLVDWRTRLRGWRGYLLLLIGVYTLYIVAVGGDHFRGERFFVPLVALIALLLADSLAMLMRFGQEQTILRVTSTTLLVGCLALYSFMALNRTRDFDYILRGMDEGLGIWREIGWWMADHTEPDESIAVTGAGAIAYYGQRTTIDMLGLNDHYIARVETPDMGTGPAGHEKRAPAYVVHERRPTYIPHMWTDYFPDQAYLEPDYVLVTITTRYGRELLMWQRRHP